MINEDIYKDEVLHYDAVIAELHERTKLSEEICEIMYDAIADILIELGIMEVKENAN